MCVSACQSYPPPQPCALCFFVLTYLHQFPRLILTTSFVPPASHLCSAVLACLYQQPICRNLPLSPACLTQLVGTIRLITFTLLILNYASITCFCFYFCFFSFFFLRPHLPEPSSLYHSFLLHFNIFTATRIPRLSCLTLSHPHPSSLDLSDPTSELVVPHPFHFNLLTLNFLTSFGTPASPSLQRSFSFCPLLVHHPRPLAVKKSLNKRSGNDFPISMAAGNGLRYPCMSGGCPTGRSLFLILY